jgi:voltage-gated potassium channel
MKKRIYEILEQADPDDRASQLFDVFIITLIVLNVAAVVLETVGSLYERYQGWFAGFELFTVAVFTVEYVLRLWSCTVDYRYAAPVKGRLRFALTPLALFDLLAILPFWLTLMQVDARIIRLIRVLRLFRLAKLSRYSLALQTLGRVFVQRREELMVTVVLMSVLLVIASAFMYHAEHEAQPEAFSSIPAAMWWAVATLTTVGYGDIYPVTPAGKALGAVIAVLGIGMFALPTGVLGAAFMEEIERHRNGKTEPEHCPHCGAALGEQRHSADGVEEAREAS